MTGLAVQILICQKGEIITTETSTVIITDKTTSASQKNSSQ